jgi:NNP family nitrate/nitrite transporter-like MFS transporter
LTYSFPLRTPLLLLFIFYLNFLSRIVIAPLLPLIEVEFGLGHGAAGSIFLFIASGYCVGLFGSTFVSSRLNHRRTILLSSMMAGGIMLTIARSASVSQMNAGLFLVGISTGLYLPSGIATLTDLIRMENWGKAMGLHEMAPNLAFVTAPLLAESLLRTVSWRDVFGFLGLSMILMGVLFLLLAPGGSQKGEPPNSRTMGKIVGNRSFWIMAAVFVLSIGASLGVYAMLPLFLVSDIGFNRELANTLVGLSRISGLIMVFMAGLITDRIGPKQALVLFLAITGTGTLMLGLVRGHIATSALVFLQATSVTCPFPAGLAMVSQTFPSQLRSVAVSLLILIGFLLGGGGIPPLIGYFAEVFSFSFGFSLLGISILALLPLFLHLKAS